MLRNTINSGVKYLETQGIFEGQHYIVSLQGPTFIFTAFGSTLLNDTIKNEVGQRGILILA
jgi:hypothetical protein